MKVLSLIVYKLWQRLMFLKSRSNCKVNVTRSKLWYDVKGLVTRNTHVKYERFVSHGSFVMTKVKIFEKLVKYQGQGH